MTAELHVIDLRADGWELLHPPTCGADCEVGRAASAGVPRPHPQRLGRHPCHLANDGSLVVDLSRTVWLDTDRLGGDLLPPAMSRRIDRSADQRREDSTALVRDTFSPWRG